MKRSHSRRASGRSPGAGLAVRILAPFAFGYFLSYLLRNANAVISPELRGDLGLSAADLVTNDYIDPSIKL